MLPKPLTCVSLVWIQMKAVVVPLSPMNVFCMFLRREPLELIRRIWRSSAGRKMMRGTQLHPAGCLGRSEDGVQGIRSSGTAVSVPDRSPGAIKPQQSLAGCRPAPAPGFHLSHPGSLLVKPVVGNRMISVECVTAAGFGGFFCLFFFCFSWLNVALVPGGEGGKPVSHAPHPAL